MIKCANETKKLPSLKVFDLLPRDCLCLKFLMNVTFTFYYTIKLKNWELLVDFKGNSSIETVLFVSPLTG
jgi:hypothetical protein